MLEVLVSEALHHQCQTIELPWLLLHYLVWNFETSTFSLSFSRNPCHARFFPSILLFIQKHKGEEIKTMITRWKCKAFWISRDSSLIFLAFDKRKTSGGVLLMQQPVPFLSLVSFQLQIFFLPFLIFSHSWTLFGIFSCLSWYLYIRKSRQAEVKEKMMKEHTGGGGSSSGFLQDSPGKRQKQGMKKTRKEYKTRAESES